MHHRPGFHDPDATTGLEIMEHMGLTTGLEAIGELFGPPASIVLGQAENARKPIKAILLATLGR
jgi:hypothetical protein